MADIQQSISFLLSSRWLAENKINVETSTCWAEGWFLSTGDLASGIWILTIAIHTFFALVRGYKLPYPVFIAVIFAVWAFIYAMAIIGVLSHRSDFYVRAGAWCWINKKYQDERLWLHYFWIFIAMFGTIATYSIIFGVLQRRVRASNASDASSSSLRRYPTATTDPITTSRVAKYMLIYPTIYVTCTLPLAASRMAAMTGREIPFSIYCLAGAFITSNGWLDVIMYALTRQVLIFRADPPSLDDMGIDTFGGMWDAKNSLFGTTTRIEGGVLSHRKDRPSSRRARSRGATPTQGRRISSRSGSMDDLFGIQVPGHVHQKTTVQVQTSNIHDDDVGDIGMRDLSRDSGKSIPKSMEQEYDYDNRYGKRLR
ncbi:MAG: hypothetical protein Q9160_006068 [Pyrenula sp. 1 TL-2023]